RRRHTRFSRDWSSDVCSSDLRVPDLNELGDVTAERERVRDLLIKVHLRRLPSCSYLDFQSGRSPTLILGEPIAHLPSVETDGADVILGCRIALVLIALGDELGNHRMERFHSVLR